MIAKNEVEMEGYHFVGGFKNDPNVESAINFMEYVYVYGIDRSTYGLQRIHSV